MYLSIFKSFFVKLFTKNIYTIYLMTISITNLLVRDKYGLNIL